MINVAQSSDEPGRQIPTQFFFFKLIRYGTRITIRFGTYFKVRDSASLDGFSSGCLDNMIRQNLRAVVKVA